MSSPVWYLIDSSPNLESLKGDQLKFEVDLTIKVGDFVQEVTVRDMRRIDDEANDIVWFQGQDNVGMKLFIRCHKGVREMRWPMAQLLAESSTTTPDRPSRIASWELPKPPLVADEPAEVFKLTERAVAKICNRFTGCFLLLCVFLWGLYGVRAVKIAGVLATTGVMVLFLVLLLWMLELEPGKKLTSTPSRMWVLAHGVGLLVAAIVFARL